MRPKDSEYIYVGVGTMKYKDKTDGSTSLGYTEFRGEQEHLKIETRLIGESFVLFVLLVTCETQCGPFF